jgi:Lrp/AsnC family leucine-responsive transcriptional regulator
MNEHRPKAGLSRSLRTHSKVPPHSIDATDAALLRALSQDARLTRAELARRVGLSPPSVGERVRRLEDLGVITGYHAAIDPARIGLPLTILIRARPAPGQMARMVEAIRDTPQVVRCDRVSGEDCFVAWAHVRDVAEMEAVIDRIVPFGATNTAIVQSASVEPRMVGLAESNVLPAPS